MPRPVSQHATTAVYAAAALTTRSGDRTRPGMGVEGEGEPFPPDKGWTGLSPRPDAGAGRAHRLSSGAMSGTPGQLARSGCTHRVVDSPHGTRPCRLNPPSQRGPKPVPNPSQTRPTGGTGAAPGAGRVPASQSRWPGWVPEADRTVTPHPGRRVRGHGALVWVWLGWFEAKCGNRWKFCFERSESGGRGCGVARVVGAVAGGGVYRVVMVVASAAGGAR